MLTCLLLLNCVVICVITFIATADNDAVLVNTSFPLTFTNLVFGRGRKIQRHEHPWQNGKNDDGNYEYDLWSWCGALTTSLTNVCRDGNQSRWWDSPKWIFNLDKWRGNVVPPLWKWRSWEFDILFRIFYFTIDKFWLFHTWSQLTPQNGQYLWQYKDQSAVSVLLPRVHFILFAVCAHLIMTYFSWKMEQID